MEPNVLPDLEETGPKALITGSSDYADTLDYGHFSSYEYMNNNEEVEDFTGTEVKERPEEHQYWSRLNEELGSLPSLSDLESECEHSNFKLEQNREYEIDGSKSADGNLPFGSKPYNVSESRPLSSPCTIEQVVVSLSLPQAEEEGGTAQDQFMLELTNPEPMFNWNSEDTGSADSTEQPTLDYDYINRFESIEEEGEVCNGLLRPESPWSSNRMSDLSLTHNPSVVTHSGVQELKETSVLLKSEPLVEPELESRNTRSIFRTLPDQTYPYCLVMAPSSSFEPDHGFHAITRSQRFMVHSTRAANMEIIRTSWRRSYVNFDEGIERSALDDVCVHEEEDNHPTRQALSGYTHEMSIKLVTKQDLEYLTRNKKLRLIPAISYKFSMMGSILRTSTIENLSCSMLINSGFDWDMENMLRALGQVPIKEGSQELGTMVNASDIGKGISWNLSTGVKTSQSAKDSILCTNFGDKALVFVQPLLASQGKHIDCVYDIVLSAYLFKNGTRRVCPLLAYLVVWAPMDYIADITRSLYGVGQVEVIRMEADAQDRLSFLIWESNAEKPRPMGLNAYVDGDVDKLPEAKFKEPRPASLKESILFPAHVYVRAESSEEIDLMQDELGGNSFESESLMNLFRAEEAVEPEDRYQAHGFNLPELGLLDLGDEFKLESFLFIDEADSGECGETSKIVSEKARILDETLTLMPLEPRFTEKETGLSIVQSLTDSGLSQFDMVVECNVV